MIIINIVRDSQGFIWEFTVEGHAGFSEEGSDIVCAAVSAIAFTALGSLDEMLGINNYIEKDGYIKCNISLDISEDKKRIAAIILDSMAIGLKQMEIAYGEYITLVDEEV